MNSNDKRSQPHQAGHRAVSKTVALPCVAPYDWPGVLSFFRVRAIPGVEFCDDSRYWRTVRIDGEAGLICVGPAADRRSLKATLYGPEIAEPAPVVARLTEMFDTRAGMRRINRVLDGDLQLKPIASRTAAVRVAGCWDRFELIVRAILGQQVTVAAGRTLSLRLCQAFGQRLVADPPAETGMNRLFPTPEALADADIQSIGVPARRAQTVRAVSGAVARGAICLAATSCRDDAEAALLAVTGIGPWTAGYVRMRAFKDPDAFPAADIALLNAARRLQIADSHKTLLAAAQRWRPWRAYAAVRLWHALAWYPPD